MLFLCHDGRIYKVESDGCTTNTLDSLVCDLQSDEVTISMMAVTHGRGSLSLQAKIESKATDTFDLSINSINAILNDATFYPSNISQNFKLLDESSMSIVIPQGKTTITIYFAKIPLKSRGLFIIRLSKLVCRNRVRRNIEIGNVNVNLAISRQIPYR